MVDLGSLPPEITSAMIYSGPGSSSMMAAASAWNGLAAELNSAALGYDKVLTALSSEEWMGPASASMVSAAQPYVTWMATTATQAEEAAARAQAAAGAYETALASVVPPPLIALNRANLVQAQQYNVLGLNNGVIAQLEAQYSEFWAQNAAAMYSYAGQSAAAAKVTPYTSAPTIVNPAASANQGAAVAAAQAGPAASLQQTLQGYLKQFQGALALLASPSGTAKLVSQAGTQFPSITEAWFLLTGQTILPTSIGSMLNGVQPYASYFYNVEGLPYFSVGMGNFGTQIAKSSGLLTAPAAAAAAAVPKALPSLGGLLGGGGAIAKTAGAVGELGGAGSLGKLTVPASWVSATAGASHAAPQLVSTVSAAPEAAAGAGGPGSLLGGLPLAGAGSGAAGAGPRYGFKPTVMARPPLGG